MRNAETIAAGVEERAAEIFGGRVGHGVDEDVELAVFLLQRGEQRFDFGVARYVALETAGAGELVDQVFGLGLHALVLVADGQGGAGRMQFLGDAPGDGTLVGQPEDYGRFACQIDHSVLMPPRICKRGNSGIAAVFRVSE